MNIADTLSKSMTGLVDKIQAESQAKIDQAEAEATAFRSAVLTKLDEILELVRQK